MKKNGKDALQEASRQILFEYRELEKKEKKEKKEEIGINLKNLNENTECRKNSVNEADNENIVDCDDVNIEIINDAEKNIFEGKVDMDGESKNGNENGKERQSQRESMIEGDEKSKKEIKEKEEEKEEEKKKLEAMEKEAIILADDEKVRINEEKEKEKERKRQGRKNKNIS